jgi:hypothetical protein
MVSQPRIGAVRDRHAPTANHLRQVNAGEIHVRRNAGIIEDCRKGGPRMLARLVVLQALVRDIDAARIGRRYSTPSGPLTSIDATSVPCGTLSAHRR